MLRLLGLLGLASEASSQLHVFDHDGDSLGVEGGKIAVFEKAGHVAFSGFLEGDHSLRGEASVRVLRPSNIPDETLERELRNEQLGLPLVLHDLLQRARALLEPLLDSTLVLGALGGGIRDGNPACSLELGARGLGDLEGVLLTLALPLASSRGKRELLGAHISEAFPLAGGVSDGVAEDNLGVSSLT